MNPLMMMERRGELARLEGEDADHFMDLRKMAKTPKKGANDALMQKNEEDPPGEGSLCAPSRLGVGAPQATLATLVKGLDCGGDVMKAVRVKSENAWRRAGSGGSGRGGGGVLGLRQMMMVVVVVMVMVRT